jgi:hypothetical protein
MADPGGLAASGAFQGPGGRPLVDTSALYFYGNSVGGILGGVATAVGPDVRRAVLGVTGIDLFNLMVPRSTSLGSLGKFVLRNYRDRSLHPLILDLLQQLWDRADPDAYAAQMISSPPPNTPSHDVLLQVAYGDFQVSVFAAAVEARTIGAHAYEPALEPGDGRVRDSQLMYGVPAIGAGPFGGPAIVVWDSGPGRTQPPPLEGRPPTPGAANQDPHEDPRYTPAAQAQISAFMHPQGGVLDVCGGQPCQASAYVP